MRLSEDWCLKKQEWITPETWASFKEEHGAIVKAVRERNEKKAQETMFTHLLSVRTHIQSTY